MQTATGKVTAYKDPNLPQAPGVSAGPDWVEALKAITPPQAETLLAAVTTLYPHESLSPLIYRRVIVQFDRIAAQKPDAAKTFAAFSDELNRGAVLPFAELAESYRVQTLKRLETTPEFFFVQRLAIRYLYDDVEVWAAFGYEGASVHLGGYVKRGFDDLDWLPPLPNEI
jgi:hypothetical protein